MDQVSNSGYPINSPGNDIDVEVSHDGMFALLLQTEQKGMEARTSIRHISKSRSPVCWKLWKTLHLFQFLKTICHSTDVNVPIETAQKSAIPQRDFVCKPIYFAQDEDVLNTFNQNSLKSLADLMLIYPELKVQLFSHFTSDGKRI